MKALKIAVLSTAIAFAPAAMAQVAEYPPEAPEEQAPETTQDVDAAETGDTAPETTAPESTVPETPAPAEVPNEPMSL
jgi:hypothetical protein